MNLHLRRPSTSQLHLLVDMIQDFYQEEGITQDRNSILAAMQELLSNEDKGKAYFLLNEDKDEKESILGYLIWTFGFDAEFGGTDSWLTDLYVKQEHRGKGIGQKAMTLLKEQASHLGIKAIHLQVRPENLSAIKLYEKMGLERIPRYIMSLQINKPLVPTRDQSSKDQ